MHHSCRVGASKHNNLTPKFAQISEAWLNHYLKIFVFWISAPRWTSSDFKKGFQSFTWGKKSNDLKKVSHIHGRAVSSDIFSIFFRWSAGSTTAIPKCVTKQGSCPNCWTKLLEKEVLTQHWKTVQRLFILKWKPTRESRAIWTKIPSNSSGNLTVVAQPTASKGLLSAVGWLMATSEVAIASLLEHKTACTLVMQL